MSTRKVCAQCGTEYGMNQKFCPNDGSPLRAESTDDALIGQIIADRYHVTGLIGEGGMGRVYVAEHVRMGRKSALKVMSPSLATTADAITRFNREASNASRINHPNVAAIYDFGETPEGLLYIAMEFVEGETLHTLIARDGPLPIARAAHITKGVADALSAAHHLDIIHRDLKPDNIMVARQLDGTDWVKVVDFGIAKSVAQGSAGQTVTTVGVSLGTPEYMSPEQLAGEKLDHRTDIYSLGLVLFNMLTGELPYPKLTSKETLVRRLTSPPASLTDVRPDMEWPPALQDALSTALASDPHARYENVGEFGRGVLAAASNLPAPDPDETVRIVGVPRGVDAGVTKRKVTAAAAAPKRTKPLAPGQSSARPPRSKRSLGGLIGAGLAFATVAGASYAIVHNRTPSAPASNHADSASVRKPDTATVATAPAPHGVGGDSVARLSVAVVPTPAAPKHDSAQQRTPRVQHDVKPLPVAVTPPPPNRDSIIAALTDSIVKADSARMKADSVALAEARRVSRRGGNGQQLATQHPWLRANGDSVSGSTAASGANPGFQKAVDEIQGHMQRAYQAITSGQLQRAAPEMRDAQSEITILREVLPAGAQAPINLQQRLAGLRRQAFQACTSAAAADSVALLRCRVFQPGANQGGGRQGRGGAPPPPAV
jgi:eukaryotic-like serine/threonine-protein kinase